MLVDSAPGRLVSGCPARARARARRPGAAPSPPRPLQGALATGHGLHLSGGALVGALKQVATAGADRVAGILGPIRRGAGVNAAETGGRASRMAMVRAARPGPPRRSRLPLTPRRRDHLNRELLLTVSAMLLPLSWPRAYCASASSPNEPKRARLLKASVSYSGSGCVRVCGDRQPSPMKVQASTVTMTRGAGSRATDRAAPCGHCGHHRASPRSRLPGAGAGNSRSASRGLCFQRSLL
jgi:hypothetical protein